jgi:uncharacterized membrane protein
MNEAEGRGQSFRARHFRPSWTGTGQSGCSFSWAMQSPTVPPPEPDSLNSALRRNIEALRQRRRREREIAPLEERIAGRITRFTGSLRFVYLHVAIYGFWIVANLGWIAGVSPWDSSFVILAMIASVEAIFLSTFILITQNRMSAMSERRAELDVQVSLLAEQEITKLVEMVSEIARRMGMEPEPTGEVDEMKRMVAPEAVLDAIEEEEAEAGPV